MLNIKKFGLLFLFFMMKFNINAQVVFNTDWVLMDARSNNSILDIYDGVNGNPYLLHDWAKGSVTSGQAVLKNQMLKYDQVKNRLLVKGEDGSIKTFKTVFNSFTIADNSNDRVFLSGFIKGLYNDNFTFFEVLANGKVKFLKRDIKIISVNKEYSGKAVKNITSEVKYFICLPNKPPLNIKLGQKPILTELADQELELTSYIKANKLDLKKEDDIAKLVIHYNTL